MARSKVESSFVCQQCGNESLKWMGKCPNCGAWNSMVETRKITGKIRQTSSPNVQSKQIKPIGLNEVKAEKYARISTGMNELDMVLGGGVVPGQAILVAGEPGIGKSTLLLQIAAKIRNSKFETKSDAMQVNARYQMTVLYVCGEESPEQVAMRSQRLKVENKGTMLLAVTDVDVVIETLQSVSESRVSDIELLIIDSIQTMTTADLDGSAGSVGQVRETALRLISSAKALGIPLFIVGHVTKEGTIAGPRVLEHMVDTVLWFEGERSTALRTIRTIKNRFGATDEVAVLRMSEKGLMEVANPSEFLLEERVREVPGSVVSVVMEGSRPLLVEIQALTVASQSPVPRRVATGIDFNRLQMMVAILQRRANLNLGAMDVFVNVVGGMRVQDPALDMAICLAIASSYLDKPVASNLAAVGEVGLMGEVRKVTNLDKRIKEAKKLGYHVASAESGKLIGGAVKKLVG